MTRTFILSLVLMVLGATGANAGVIAVSGSDGDGVHSSNPAAPDWANDWIAFLRQGSLAPVLVVGDTSATGHVVTATGGVGVTTATSLTGLSLTTSNYSAIYITSVFGCCDANDALVVGFESQITSFVGSGGSFGIQSYTGESAFDFILGTSGGANGSVYGFLGGLGGTSGYDNEVVTADGIAAGFSPTNYDNLGQWGHQGYDMNFFGGLGFTSLIDAPVYSPTASAVFAKGLSAPVPAPGALALLGLGLIGLGLRRSRTVQ